MTAGTSPVDDRAYTDREIAHLRELLEQRVHAVEEKAIAMAAGNDKALTVALEEQRAKWIVANEFRGTISDYRNHTIPRPEAEERFKGFDKELDVLKAFMHAQQGSKTSLLAAVGILLGVIGAGLAIYNTTRIP